MCKVYLYSRVSTSAQTLAQQERTVYEWLKLHNMHVDEVVSDCGISGGVSYADRDLGKVLLPKMQAGDMLIVSEISRLGRSMFDLSKLIHTELKPRKLRLVVCNMSIDLRCDKLTAIDELILNQFSFAAQLEKQLISERTLSALEVKRKQGIKFGSASLTYIENRKKKSKEQLKDEGMKRGRTKNIRHLQGKEARTFAKVLRLVYPDACSGAISSWKWNDINTKKENRIKVITLMRDYRDIDNELFRTWKFEEGVDSIMLQRKLSGSIASFKKSVERVGDEVNEIMDL